MNQVRHISDWLECDLGAVKCAAARSGAGSKQFVATLLSLLVWLRLIRGAGGLIEHLLYLRTKTTHRHPALPRVCSALPDDVEAIVGLRYDVGVLIDVIEDLIQNGDQ